MQPLFVVASLLVALVVAGLVVAVRKRGWRSDQISPGAVDEGQKASLTSCFLLVMAGAAVIGAAGGRLPLLLLGVAVVLGGLVAALALVARHRSGWSSHD